MYIRKTAFTNHINRILTITSTDSHPTPFIASEELEVNISSCCIVFWVMLVQMVQLVDLTMAQIFEHVATGKRYVSIVYFLNKKVDETL
jgi:hypothetical protein